MSLDQLRDYMPHLNRLTAPRHLWLANSECIGCIKGEPGCKCCGHVQKPQPFDWYWQVCYPHLLESEFPSMIRMTMGPRSHGDPHHFVVPSLLLDEDLQPGDEPGGGRWYAAPGDHEPLVSGDVLAPRPKEGNDDRPIFISIFTTFHQDIDEIFESAMINRERLVLGICKFLHEHGESFDKSNLDAYSVMFTESNFNISSDMRESLPGMQAATPINIVMFLGSLASKVTFPTRRTFHALYRRTVFCPIPSGDVPHVSRFFHVVLCGCIPVVLTYNASINDHTSFHQSGGASYLDSYPFVDLIDYRRAVVEIPFESVDEIVEILTSIPQSVIREKQSYLRQVRSLFVHDFSGSTFDTFSASLREIVRRIPM